MNQVLQEWLIEQFGGFEFTSGTGKHGGQRVRVGFQEIEVDENTTPNLFLRKLKEAELRIRKRELENSINTTAFLRGEIASLEKELGIVHKKS